MASSAVDLLIGKIFSILQNEMFVLGQVHDQLDEIMRELLTMKAFLADTKRKGALTEVEKTWMSNVRDVSIDIEEILDEFTYDMNKKMSRDPFTRALRQSIRFPKTLWEKHQIAAKLQKIIKTVKAIPERNHRYGVDRMEGIGTSHNYGSNQVRVHSESSLFFKDDELVGIKDAKEKLVGWLLFDEEPQRTVISVIGMGGSGKTTIAASNFNSQVVKKHFDCQAWITVSQTYNIEDLLRVIINQLFTAAKKESPQDLSNMSYIPLVEVLVNYLQPKRYVIVFDDVWDINLWRQINVALPDGRSGSRVLLTTRKEDIASFPFGVGCHVYYVQRLNMRDAWDLFCKKAFCSWKDSCCPTELEPIARDLVRKCGGLPLGIVALGALMSTKRLMSEWKKFYSCLNWELSNNTTLEELKYILLLSFNDLPYRLKNCFLYFCLFPEDYVISGKRVIRLWMAEGFVEQVGGATPEEIGESYVAELTCRCMLQVVQREPSGRAITFKMHDLLRELALSTSKAERFCTVYTTQDANAECRDSPGTRLSIQGKYGEPQPYRDMSKVRTFFTFDPMLRNHSFKLPSGFKLLLVLDLERNPIDQLPNETVKFFNLKYLNLKETNVKELPKGIGKLQNLETLDIRNSKIRALPVGIKKLKSLRHLLMYHYNMEDAFNFGMFDGTRAPFDISKLESLQVLEGIEVGGMQIKQLGQMTQLRILSVMNVTDAGEEDLCKSIESMKLIEHLAVKTSNEAEVLSLDELPSAPPSLHTLALEGKLEKVPHWFHSLLSLTSLSLYSTRLTEDFLPCIQDLPKLTKLILWNAQVGTELVFYTGFHKLTELIIGKSPQLNAVIIERGVMPSLQKLVVYACFELKQLPQGIEHLTGLKQLEMVGVSDALIGRTHGDGSLDHSKIKHISKVFFQSKTEFEVILAWLSIDDEAIIQTFQHMKSHQMKLPKEVP